MTSTIDPGKFVVVDGRWIKRSEVHRIHTGGVRHETGTWFIGTPRKAGTP